MIDRVKFIFATLRQVADYGLTCIVEFLCLARLFKVKLRSECKLISRWVSLCLVWLCALAFVFAALFTSGVLSLATHVSQDVTRGFIFGRCLIGLLSVTLDEKLFERTEDCLACFTNNYDEISCG